MATIEERVAKLEAIAEDSKSRTDLFWTKDWPSLQKSVDKIEAAVDHISETLNKISMIQREQQLSLDHHIKRTDLLEEKVSELKKEMRLSVQLIRTESAPIIKHVDRVQFLFAAIKWIGVSTVFAAIVIIIKSTLGL